jgi:hypothetical protein
MVLAGRIPNISIRIHKPTHNAARHVLKKPKLNCTPIVYLESFLRIFLASFQLKSGVRIRSVNRAENAFTVKIKSRLYFALLD